MPDEALWETLFDVPLILDRLGIDGTTRDVVEIGCGYGTFTIPIAQRISGQIFTFDIDPLMIRRTQQRAAESGISNIVYSLADVMTDDCPAPTADGCLLFNILHGEHPTDLLSKAASFVRNRGYVWAIHWRYSPSTPRGPSMAIRPRPEQIPAWAEQTGILTPIGKQIDLPPWHYGWKVRRA